MSMKIKPIQLAGILTIWIFAVGLIVTFNNHSIRTQVSPRYVNVVGDGSVKVTPDSVRVDASVSNVAASSAASLAATAKSADSMRTSLKGSGVEANYIKALNLSTNPEYSYPNNGPAKLTGYRSTQSFSIVIRDAKNAGMIIQSAQSAVGNSLSINSTSPYVFDQKIAEANARALAIASAKAKAQSYAELTGSKLGKVLSIDEQITQSNPMPLMAVAKSMDASAAPVRVDLGQQDITINVTTKWELK
jgi:uncharacterized protein YggE